MSLVVISYLYVSFVIVILMFYQGFLVVIFYQENLLSLPFLVIFFSKASRYPLSLTLPSLCSPPRRSPHPISISRSQRRSQPYGRQFFIAGLSILLRELMFRLTQTETDALFV